jgi:Na+/serine symporter
VIWLGLGLGLGLGLVLELGLVLGLGLGLRINIITPELHIRILYLGRIFFYSLQSIIDVFLIIRKNALSYDNLKDRYKPQMLFYVYTGRLTYITTCIQCGLDILLNPAFKSIFGLCYM